MKTSMGLVVLRWKHVGLRLLGGLWLACSGFFPVTPIWASALPSVTEKTSEALAKLRPLQEAKDWPGVLAILNAVPEVKPGSYDEAVILDAKARTFGLMEQPAKALEPWERALQLSEAHDYFGERQTLEITLYLAQLHAQEGFVTKVPGAAAPHFAKAIVYFRRYLAKTPAPPTEVLMTCASVLFQQATAEPNRPDPALLREARAITDRALISAIKPRENIYYLEVALHQQDNDSKGASELIELLVHARPDKRDYWQSLVGLYQRLSDDARQDQPAVARQYLIRQLLTIERAQSHGFFRTSKERLYLCSLYFKANQFTKGTELLYRGMLSGEIDSEPNNWRLLGRFYQEANRPREAVRALEEGIARFPRNSELEMQLAELHLRTEEMAAAFAHAQAAAAKNNFETTRPFAAYCLIAFTAFDLERLDDAHRAILEAEKFPEDARRDGQFAGLKDAVEAAIARREAKLAGRTAAPPRDG